MMSEVEKLEQEISKFREQVALKDAAVRLQANKDFRDLILTYFCTHECARYVQVSTDPNLPEQSRKDALAVAQAAGYFKRFLNTVVQMGEMAERGIRDNETMMDELRAQ